MANHTEPEDARQAMDWARRPAGQLFWWGLPIAIGIAGGALGFTYQQAALIWAGAFVWMAAGCLLNAWRCHRVHCYISGPVLLAAGIAAAMLGFDLVTLGPRALSYVVWSAFGLSLLSFAPEMLWRKYAG